MAKKKSKPADEEVPQVTDEKLFKLWTERNEIDARIAKLSAMKAKRDDTILTEFERRGIKTITSAVTGDRITYVQGESVVYDFDGLVTSLKRSDKGRTIVKRCEKTIIDTRAVAAEVQAGHINPALVRKHSSIKQAKPYLRGGKIET